jgi:hypothetical protein
VLSLAPDYPKLLLIDVLILKPYLGQTDLLHPSTLASILPLRRGTLFFSGKVAKITNEARVKLAHMKGECKYLSAQVL